jgi:hypothetical protein
VSAVLQIDVPATPSIETFLRALDDATAKQARADEATGRIDRVRQHAEEYRRQVIAMASPNGRVDTDRAWMVAILDRIVSLTCGVREPRPLGLPSAAEPTPPEPTEAPDPDQHQLAV